MPAAQGERATRGRPDPSGILRSRARAHAGQPIHLLVANKHIRILARTAPWSAISSSTPPAATTLAASEPDE